MWALIVAVFVMGFSLNRTMRVDQSTYLLK
jgi:hypothetical protein